MRVRRGDVVLLPSAFTTGATWLPQGGSCDTVGDG